MGEEIEDGSARPEDRERFAERCREGLVALQELLARPGFGAGPDSMGVELEVGLIDERAQPAPVNHQVIATADEPGLQLELDRFNLEYNCLPQRLAGAPFSAIADDLAGALARIEAAAAVHGARPVAVGILPDPAGRAPRRRGDERLPALPGAERRAPRPARGALRDPHPGRREPRDDLGRRHPGGRGHGPARAPARAPRSLRRHDERGPDGHRPGPGRRGQLAAPDGEGAVAGDADRPVRAGGGRSRARDRRLAALARLVRPRMGRRRPRSLQRERGPARPDPPGARRRGAARGAARRRHAVAPRAAPPPRNGVALEPHGARRWATIPTCGWRCARSPAAPRRATWRPTWRSWWA